MKFPDIHCFVPDEIHNNYLIEKEKKINQEIEFQSDISKEEYLKNILKIKEHIQKGDFYEANYCYQWISKVEHLNSKLIFENLMDLTNPPYGFYADLEKHHIISASPELFIKKRANKLYSSPIKGTQKRDLDPIKDQLLKKQLKDSLKDQAENNMIVDLVRNDLSKIALKSTVKMEELRKVYTFKNIHQMISTISCEISENEKISNIIKASFPMGSMTGAPKIKVMQIMEDYEVSKRGLYSGSFGIIYPNGDFDFNVIIRTLIYNKANHLLSFHVGGAITIDSDPNLEYEETLIKAEALFKACQ
jgi:para-aminobenzoate synthetase component 1